MAKSLEVKTIHADCREVLDIRVNEFLAEMNAAGETWELSHVICHPEKLGNKSRVVAFFTRTA